MISCGKAQSMNDNVIIHTRQAAPPWPGLSLLLLLLFFLIPIALAIGLNRSGINHLLFPVGGHMDMFRLIWQDNPLGAMQFISNKSLFSLAHHDPHSGLKLWTLEYDTITLVIYLLTALLTAGVLKAAKIRKRLRNALLFALPGCILIVTAFSYMTSISHCPGSTWVGFVAAYGLGYENFQHYPDWQIGLAAIGLLLLGREWWQQRQA